MLAYDQAPPVSVPYRFFASGLLFGLVGAMLTWVAGPSLWGSRWSPAVLAFTHLFTAGFMLHIMCGALFQLLPVAAGVALARPQRLANWAHPLMCAGSALLPAGMYAGAPRALMLGAACLGAGVLALVVTFMRALVRQDEVPIGLPSTTTVNGMRLALLALGVTLCFGLAGVNAMLGGGGTLPVLIGLHVQWGLLGWGGALVFSVALLVIPMFQTTPPYPPRVGPLLLSAVLLALLLGCMAVLQGWGALESAARWLGNAAVAVFSGLSLWLLHRRRRRRMDETAWFWVIGLLCAVATVFLPFLADPEGDLSLPIGVLAIYGVFVSIITGMLFRIVPFLNWLHLSGGGVTRERAGDPLPAVSRRVQLGAHTVALISLLATAAGSAPAWTAALAVSGAQAWLCWTMGRAMWRLRIAPP